MENKETFLFTYSAGQQKEIEAIRSKYLPQEESKIDRLRRLHAIPTKKALAASLAVGITGVLVMGLGMSLAMTELGNALGGFAMVLGIPVGIIGIVLAALAYPVYNRVLKVSRRKIAPEILHLTEELLQ